jgi:hypothetical protein
MALGVMASAAFVDVNDRMFREALTPCGDEHVQGEADVGVEVGHGVSVEGRDPCVMGDCEEMRST